MARVFLLGIAFYLVFRLIFDLIVPIYKTTRQVRRQFSNIRDQMQGQANQGNATQSHAQHAQEDRRQSAGKQKAGEYIDFEELK